jgi:outer membrane lipoprotein-sorting protein
MMRYFSTLFATILLFSLNSFSQSDQEAVKILDRFADNALNAPSVSMKFKLFTINQTDMTKDTLEGSVILVKDKYKLDIPNNIVWFNGETSWSYLIAEDEVTITKPDKKDNSFQNRPSLIFSMYKKGYKNRVIEERSDSYIIDLYPEDIKSELLRVRLKIGKSLMNLISLEYKRKDGVVSTLDVLEYDLKQKPSGELFVFPAGKYKDAEIVDMR